MKALLFSLLQTLYFVTKNVLYVYISLRNIKVTPSSSWMWYSKCFEQILFAYDNMELYFFIISLNIYLNAVFQANILSFLIPHYYLYINTSSVHNTKTVMRSLYIHNHIYININIYYIRIRKNTNLFQRGYLCMHCSFVNNEDDHYICSLFHVSIILPWTTHLYVFASQRQKGQYIKRTMRHTDTDADLRAYTLFLMMVPCKYRVGCDIK